MTYVAKVGDRVVAVRDANSEVVSIFGHGEYVGDEVPSKEAAERNNFALMLRGLEKSNPRVVLDDGKGDVYGCECWWGPESGFEAFVSGRRIEIAPLDPPIPDDLMKVLESSDAPVRRD